MARSFSSHIHLTLGNRDGLADMSDQLSGKGSFIHTLIDTIGRRGAPESRPKQIGIYKGTGSATPESP